VAEQRGDVAERLVGVGRHHGDVAPSGDGRPGVAVGGGRGAVRLPPEHLGGGGVTQRKNNKKEKQHQEEQVDGCYGLPSAGRP